MDQQLVNQYVGSAANNFWLVAKMVLIFLLLASSIYSAIQVYYRVTNNSDGKSTEHMVFWLRGVMFLVIALGMVGGISNMLDGSISLTGKEIVWLWAEKILTVSIFVVFIAAVIQVYNSDGGEFKGNLNRFLFSERG